MNTREKLITVCRSLLSRMINFSKRDFYILTKMDMFLCSGRHYFTKILQLFLHIFFRTSFSEFHQKSEFIKKIFLDFNLGFNQSILLKFIQELLLKFAKIFLPQFLQKFLRLFNIILGNSS